MNKLRADAERSPIFHIAVIWLFAVGFASLPLKNIFLLFTDDRTLALYLSSITVRSLCSVAAIVAVYSYGFSGLIKTRVSVKGMLLCIPALLVAVNNFPIIGAASGEVVFSGNATYTALFIVECLFIGLFEETVFRGIIFPLVFFYLKDKKRAAFWAAAVSSAIFALTHLINLFAGAGFGATILQVGYSFLVGGLCAISVLKTGSVIPAVIIHFIYDLGGLLLNAEYNVATGSQWDTLTVIITAALGVAVAVFEVIYALRSDGGALKRSCRINDGEENAIIS